MEIDFDPAVITYKELLDEFWQGHDPTSRSWSRQYMSAIFYHNAGQKRLALETKEREEKRRDKTIQTKILPFRKFTLAEDYHQKHALRRFPDVLSAAAAPYRGDLAGFVNSTVVTRLNGYLGGYGYYADLEAEIDSYGLPPEIKTEVLDKARRVLAKKPVSACPVR